MTVLSTDTILYGGDYNPEQWDEVTWKQDMVLFREAGLTTVTLNVFAWASLQPSEDVYDFERLDTLVELAADAGMAIVLGTSTAALPPWMALRHPDVNRVDFQGRKMRHGRRHNACITSPTYRKYSAALAGRLAERYGSHPAVVAWHISNEYGGFCWCENCAASFRDWLRERYGSVEAVNAAWNTAFWSHTFHSFDEIFPPNLLGDAIDSDLTSNSAFVGSKAVLPGYSLDYRRFYGQRVLESYREEKAAIREHDPVHPITTNMMGTFPDYDYFEWSDDLDIVSWDSYPAHDTTPAQVRMTHDLMRAVGRQANFMLMETTPSRQNWQPYNSLKRPGQMRQQAWQAISRGADTVQFFQLRQSPGGCEKFHGAVIGSDGTSKPRQFREVAELGAELGRVSGHILGSRVEPGRVGIVFDWPSRWGIDLSAGPSVSLDYVAEIQRWYDELYARNIAVDLLSRTSPFQDYDVVVAPCLYLLPQATIDALREFVAAGGRLVLTPMSALVDDTDLLFQGEAPVPFRDLAGIWVEETDALPPGVRVPLRFAGEPAGAGEILCDVVHPDPGTQVLATYDGEYYAGTPALTFRPSPAGGGIFYLATFPDAGAIAPALDAILDGTGIEQVRLPGGVELSRRLKDDGGVLTFLINTTSQTQVVTAPAEGVDVLTGAAVSGEVELGAYGVVVLSH